METWEDLQARLFHLGWLAEELPAFVARPSGAWLFREIVRECQTVAAIAAAYVAETERAGLTGPAGDTPPAGLYPCGNPHPGSTCTSTDTGIDTDTGTAPGDRVWGGAGGDLCPRDERGDAL
jgi:hypothetical protein